MRSVLFMIVVSFGVFVEAFRTGFITKPQKCQHPITSSLFLSSSDVPDNEEYDPKKMQEALFEQLSKSGAANVAKMDVAERTKRAILAEAVEDRILLLEDDLEELIPSGIIPKDEKIREKAVEIAQTIRACQQDYSRLVNGEPSPLLDTLDSLGDGN
eukprot:CAMPEP_0202451872 /NCGR_PEP_ID=MMETSP1360-20130828/10198_1 /ASSEMBLY_ACC=CAM_ASM_000848 /TAXON_ID=515479 /ORGANISM="Licmophora paradoxa, Strain CCMP2313" /LENGTH=156 /DNA_ID=CAMNT_0049070539 /DNA_START=148 /DNA_END=618 /DNA_ORIENTATION=-